jgi:HK97 family phage major capsid protein
VTTLRAFLERRAAIAAEMRQINDAAGDNDLTPEQRTKFDGLKAELDKLEERIARQSALEDAERRMQGQPIGGTGDRNLDRELRSFSLVRAIASQVPGLNVDAARERELSQEIARRAGRPFQGIAVPTAIFHQPVEQRVLTTTIGTAGGFLVQTDVDGAQFIDRLRAALTVRRLGARVLSGLQGNLTVPALASSATADWVAENAAITGSDHTFRAVNMTPKHVGAITELSRNMLMQPSVDVENLVRSDFAQVLADAVDKAAINGAGVGAQPAGILGTSGIGTVDMSTVTWGDILEFIADVETANSEGSAFLTNPKVVKLLRSTLKVSGDAAAGFIMEGPDSLAGYPCARSTNVPSTLGGSSDKSALIFGNWPDLMLGYWAELDILVNPYEATAYSKGNVKVRGMLTMDIAVRHAGSFAAATDIAA